MVDKNKWLGDGVFFVGLLILCGLVFGLYITQMGFFWDDLPYNWFNLMEGPAGAARAYAMDRPVLAGLYFLSMSLMPADPFSWQILALLFKYILGIAFYFVILEIWPDHKLEAKVITILFLVYPGFQQQWIAITYFHQYLVFSLYLISLILSVRAVLKPRYFSAILVISLVLQGLCLFAMEHLFGFEVLRPLLFYIVLRREMAEKTDRSLPRIVFKKWYPFAMVSIFFVLHRAFISQSVLNSVVQLEKLRVFPLTTLLDFLKTQSKNLLTAAIKTWGLLFSDFQLPLVANIGYPVILILFAGLILSIGMILYFSFQESKIPAIECKSDKNYFIELSLVAILALFFAGTSFWAAGLNVALHFPNNRFLLPFAVGGSIFIFLPLHFFRKQKISFSLLVVSVIIFSASFHLRMADEFRSDWHDLRDFLTQLTWRAPDLMVNTLLIAEELPFRFFSDNSLTAAINWTYSKEIQSDHLPYLLNYTTTRLGGSLKSLSPNTPVVHSYRLYTFHGSTNQMIVLIYKPGGCLHIAHPAIDIHNPNYSPILKEAIVGSNLDSILDDEQGFPELFVEQKPDRSWCYFYQKASLAFQFEEYPEIVRLGDEAFSLGLAPQDARDYVPFLYGYAQKGRWRTFRDLANIIIFKQPDYQSMLCAALETLQLQVANSDPSGQTTISDLRIEFECSRLQ